MIIEAMDLLYSHRFDAFALVSSDSDFTRLASRLRESEKRVFGIGEKKTPVLFINACSEFIYIENLGDVEDEQKPDNSGLAIESAVAPGKKSSEKPKEKPRENKPVARDSTKEIVSLLHKGWQQFHGDDGWADIGTVGGFLKRTWPDFDPRTYGATKLSQLVGSLTVHFQTKKHANGGLTAYQPKKKPASKPQG